MSRTLLTRIAALEQDATQDNGYWALPLAAFYGEDAPPIWIDTAHRRGLDDFYRDIAASKAES